MNSIDYKSKLKKISDRLIGLPTLPTVISKMIELVDNPKTSAKSLANLISTDQALTARILKLANSAYYGFPREISTVDTAIVVMGFNAVREMGLSLTVFDMFKDVKIETFDITSFWQHSFACGIATKLLSKKYGISSGEAFVSGLLHDIGKIVLTQYMPDIFEKIVLTVKSENRQFYIVEEEILNTTHAEIGGWLADKWKLPIAIKHVLKYHHTPQKAPSRYRLFALLVNFADYLVHRSGVGTSGNIRNDFIEEDIQNGLEDYNIMVNDIVIDELITDFLIEYDKNESMASFFGTVS